MACSINVSGVIFFFLSCQRNKEAKKKKTIITPDLRSERDAPELPGIVIVMTSLYAPTPYVG